MACDIMCNADFLTHEQLVRFAVSAEAAGINTVWVPELYGRDPFVTCAVILGATTTVRVGTAIANVYVRDARATKAAAYSLADGFGNRFTLGLGLSNKVGNAPRGHAWLPPIQMITDFTDRYDGAELMCALQGDVPRYLAAHGPRLMDFAAARLDGAFSYLQTLDYSAEAKAKLGAKKLLLMQPTVFEADPARARALARKAIAIYLPLENYHRAWRERGFTDADFIDGASDSFIDALIAWGDQARIGERFTEQRERGVDQIIVIPVGVDLRTDAGWSQVAALLEAAG